MKRIVISLAVFIIYGVHGLRSQESLFTDFRGTATGIESFHSMCLVNDSTLWVVGHSLTPDFAIGAYRDTAYVIKYDIKRSQWVDTIKWSSNLVIQNNFKVAMINNGILVSYSATDSGTNNYRVYLKKFNSDMNEEGIFSVAGLMGINLTEKILEFGGYYYLFIASGSDSAYYRTNLYKLDESLHLIWQRTYENTSGALALYDVVLTSEGSMVGTGYKDSGNQNWYALKIDTTGNVLWEKTYAFSPEDDIALNVHQIDSNKLLISGAWEPTAYHDRPRLLEVRLDNGNIIQTRTFENTLFDSLGSFSRLQILDDGYLFVTHKEPTYSKSVILGKMDKSYNPLWTKEYRYGLRDNYLYDIVIKPDGGILGCGSVVFQDEDLGPYNQQAWLLSLDSNGCLYPQYQCTYVDTTDTSGTTGITAVENKEEIKIYPNPTTGQLYVLLPSELLKTEGLKVDLIDIHGKHAMHVENLALNNTNMIQIDVSNMSDGIYMLKLQNEQDAVHMGKFILSK